MIRSDVKSETMFGFLGPNYTGIQEHDFIGYVVYVMGQNLHNISIINYWDIILCLRSYRM